MKAKSILTLLIVLAAISLTTQALSGCASQESRFESANEKQVNQSTGGEASYVTANSLRELVAKSTLIVVGQVSGTGETINLARNPNDITQPDPNILILGQVYPVTVERYLKGTGDRILNVVQPEAFLTERIPKTQANIANAMANYKYIPFRSGTKYLLFLEPILGFANQHYFTGPAHPWRFILPDAGNAEPESPWDLAKQVFPPRPATTLLRETEQLVKGQ
jgi:hypothetical protein